MRAARTGEESRSGIGIAAVGPRQQRLRGRCFTARIYLGFSTPKDPNAFHSDKAMAVTGRLVPALGLLVTVPGGNLANQHAPLQPPASPAEN